MNSESESRNINIEEPAQIIKKGGIVVFPTETVYGIGVNALDPKAVKRLYGVKKRPLNKPITLLVNNIDMINQIAKNITNVEYKIMETFFPGPLTIILQKKKIVPNIVTSNTEMVGVRIPANKIALKLIEYAKVPIATSSANISGENSAIELSEAKREFDGKVDYFIDGGKSKLGIASTVIQVINERPYILRKGYISEEEIQNVLKGMK